MFSVIPSQELFGCLGKWWLSSTWTLKMMEAERNLLFQKNWFAGSMLNFRGVSSILISIFWMRSLSPSMITNRINNQWLSISTRYHLEIRSSMCVLLGLWSLDFKCRFQNPIETTVIFSWVRNPIVESESNQGSLHDTTPNNAVLFSGNPLNFTIHTFALFHPPKNRCIMGM